MLPVNDERTTAADRLGEELDELRILGHVLGPWSAADPEIARELELVESARQCICACGVMLLAGWDGDGTFAVVRGVSGAYGPNADPKAIEVDLDARGDEPCRAAQAVKSFHASAGYRRFAECYSD